MREDHRFERARPARAGAPGTPAARRAFALPLLAAMAATLALAGCGDEAPPAFARRIASRAELPGGVKQYANTGDWLLQNGKVRAVVLDAGHGANPALWGGGLADVDRVRPWQEYRAGNGLDQFYLLLPMVNLQVPHPEAGQVEAYTAPDGSRAVVRVTGRGDRVLALLNMLDAVRFLGLVTNVTFRTDYELARDSDTIRITTTFRPQREFECADGADDEGDGAIDCDDADCALMPVCAGWCDRRACGEGEGCDAFYGGCLPRCGPDGTCPGDAECDAVAGLCVGRPVPMDASIPGTDLLDVLSGGLLAVLAGEDVELDRNPGFVAGDMALLGGSVQSFAPEIGFEIDAQYRMSFVRGRSALNDPLPFDYLAGVGNGVSYAFFSQQGAVLFPFATESLTGSITHTLNCRLDPADDATCDAIPLVRYTRFLSVGDGDVASASRSIFDLRGVPTGRVAGTVVRGRPQGPVHRADVYAIADPCDPARCVQVPAGCGDFADYDALAAAARACTRAPDNPDGRALVASHFRTDPAAGDRPEGRFGGPLPPGTYWLVARKDKGPMSAPVRVEVAAGRTAHAALALPETGRLTFRGFDEAGRPTPLRATIGHCFPECRLDADCPDGQACDGAFQCRPASCAADGDCDHDEACVGDRCACSPGRLPGDPREELGDGHMSDRKAAVVLSVDGSGAIDLEPGRYDVIFSRGVDCEIDAQAVEITSNRTAFLAASLPKVVDTRGWIAADQHIHTSGSSDAGTSLPDRLASAIAEGVGFLAITDHDYVSDPRPPLLENGWRDRLLSLPGLEVSTLDISHLIGFPLRWRADESTGGALGWTGLAPAQVFAWLRANGLYGPDETLVVAAHPRGGMSSYYDVFGLDPFDLALKQGSAQSMTPLLAAPNFVQDYDLAEVLNSKRLDILRMPTYDEVERYAVLERAALADVATLRREDVLARMGAGSRAILKDMMVRTPGEQAALRAFLGEPKCKVPPSCRTDADCAKGLACDPGRGLCRTPCAGPEACPAGLDCIADHCRPPADMPCEAVKGMVEDWLRMLDHGIFKPAIGGTDAHGIANYEVGSLRNYVRVPTDDPAALDPRTLIERYRQGRSFATWGPFVELTVDGRGPGETATLDGRASVPLRIRVQKPSWFDVSRVEILRNGVLEHVWDSGAADPARRLPVPSRDVLVLDDTLDVAPGEDSWFVAFAMGVEGKALDPVYGSAEQPPVYLDNLLASALGALPLPAISIAPRVPVYFPQYPMAMTNPVFLDVDGADAQGCVITPNDGPPPDWACNYPPDHPRDRMPCYCR